MRKYSYPRVRDVRETLGRAIEAMIDFYDSLDPDDERELEFEDDENEHGGDIVDEPHDALRGHDHA